MLKRLMQSPVLQLAIPMILSNLTVPLLGIVDVGVVGHLPQAYYMDAVGIGAVIFDTLFWGVGFLRMATAGLIAQAFGRRDQAEMQVVMLRSMLLALMLALVILILQKPIAMLAFWLIAPTAIVTHYGLLFYHVGIWAAPAVLLNYTLMAWFIGRQNTRIPLLLLTVANVLGIVLDCYFVMSLNMNVQGVALATVIAQYVELALGLYYLYRSAPGMFSNASLADILNRSGLSSLFNLNKNIFIRTLCLMFAFAFFNHVGATEGKIILAANVVLFNFQLFMAYALDGFVTAAEALVGKAIGADNLKAVLHAVKTCTAWSVAVALVFMLGYGLLGHHMINLMTSINSVRHMAYHYLFWVVILPIFSVWSFLYDGVFIGATLSKEMRNTMILSLATFLLAWGLLKGFGNEGLWLAFTCFMVMRGLSMFVVFHFGYLKGKSSASKRISL